MFKTSKTHASISNHNRDSEKITAFIILLCERHNFKIHYQERSITCILFVRMRADLKDLGRKKNIKLLKIIKSWELWPPPISLFWQFRFLRPGAGVG